MNQTPSENAHPPGGGLILGSRVNDRPVFGRSGERIGHVEDLSIDKASGKVVYAVMSFGGFLGMDKKFHPIPWSLLHYDPVRSGYVVTLDRSMLEATPYYDRCELGELGGSHAGTYV